MLMDLEVELGAENVKEVLGDYLSEDAVAVQDLLLNELGLTGSESTEFLEATEAMEVDQPMMLVAEAMHLPMDTGQPGVPSGTFQPELMGLGYTPSLIGSMDTPHHPLRMWTTLFWMSQIPEPRPRKHPKPQELGDQRVHQVRDPPQRQG